MSMDKNDLYWVIITSLKFKRTLTIKEDTFDAHRLRILVNEFIYTRGIMSATNADVNEIAYALAYCLINTKPEMVSKGLKNAYEQRHLRAEIEAWLVNEQTTTTSEDVTMGYEIKHLLDGKDLATMSVGELIATVQDLEYQLAKLKKIKAKSVVIRAKKEEIKRSITKVVEMMDTGEIK